MRRTLRLIAGRVAQADRRDVSGSTPCLPLRLLSFALFRGVLQNPVARPGARRFDVSTPLIEGVAVPMPFRANRAMLNPVDDASGSPARAVAAGEKRALQSRCR